MKKAVEFKVALRAYSSVRHAKKRGDLVEQPCRDCGTTENVEAHHSDYRKPLQVVWLCTKHHRKEHTKIGSPLMRSDPNSVKFRLTPALKAKLKERAAGESRSVSQMAAILVEKALEMGIKP